MSEQGAIARIPDTLTEQDAVALLRRHDSGDQVEDARVTGALSQLELDHVRWAADRGWATVNAVADDRARC